MDLREWLHAATGEEREEMARAASTSVAYLYQLAGGHRRASANMAIAIETATQASVPGTVPRGRLRPDYWPESGEASAA